MSVLTRLLESYEKNHQNPINEAIHIIAIPLIMFSILFIFGCGQENENDKNINQIEKITNENIQYHLIS